MNADKIADALRGLLPYACECASCPGYRIKNAREALAEYDAQPAQAAQPVLYAISTSMRSWWTYDKDEAGAARFDGANVQEIREQAAQPVGVPDGFLQHVAGVCGGVLAFCEPKPQKAYDDPTEYNGGQALQALAEIERDIRAMLAAPQPPAQPSECAVCGGPNMYDSHGGVCARCQDVSVPAQPSTDAEPAAWLIDVPWMPDVHAWADISPCRRKDYRSRPLYLQPSADAENDLPGMWSKSDFTGGDPDERSYAARAAEGDGK